jgi:ATP-dependent protease ClpP protease subunit
MRQRKLAAIASLAASLGLPIEPQASAAGPNAVRIADARQAWHARFDNRSAEPRATAGKLELRADGDVAELRLFDEIGPWGVSAAQFADALASIVSPRIRLRINSPGGDVFDGYAIYNALKAHPATIDVVVEGLAASIASIIAMAGDTVSMAEPSLLMVHRAWTLALGNAGDLRGTAELLDKVDQQLAGVYAARAGDALDAAKAYELMTAETWLTPAEARALGLVDAILAPDAPDPAPDAAAGPLDIHAARQRAARLVALGVR